jgi:hypothetical protein
MYLQGSMEDLVRRRLYETAGYRKRPPETWTDHERGIERALLEVMALIREEEAKERAARARW